MRNAAFLPCDFHWWRKWWVENPLGFALPHFGNPCGKNYAFTVHQCAVWKKTQSLIAPSIGQTSSRIFCRWFSSVKCSHSSEMVRLAFPGCLHWLREVVSLSLGPQHFHNARRTAGLLPRRFRRTLADGQRLALESTQKTIKSWAWERLRVAFNILQPILYSIQVWWLWWLVEPESWGMLLLDRSMGSDTGGSRVCRQNRPDTLACHKLSPPDQSKLVGGLEHFLFSIIYGIILPIDSWLIFFREVETTNQ